jgi:acetyl-CoA carboxylase carboxyl transferase subunit alpha
MLEHAVYSVISPEGCAAILWKSADKASEAAEALKMTAKDLLALKIIDDIVPEPAGCAHRNPAAMAATLKKSIAQHLASLSELSPEDLLAARYEKFRRMGAHQ